MSQTNCPDRETLEKLLLGRLPESESQQWESHLSGCENCSLLTDELHVNDDLTDDVLSAIRNPDEIESGMVSQLIDWGKQLAETVDTISASEETPLTVPQRTADLKIDQILAPAQQDDELGRLNGYRVLEVIGQGGMGVVFRAEDLKLKRQVALKTLSPTIAADPTVRERFLREAAATASIDHDHIVTIHQVGEEADTPFIAMQLLRGETLSHRLKRKGPLSQREVLRLGRHIADGLAAAHEHGLVHRDIKPANIWLEAETNRVKILDFGLARSSEDLDLTHSGTVIGTPRYMSPEQANGETVDHRSDLFSLGAVLYYAASGKQPFTGNNMTSMLVAIAHQTPLPLADLCPEFDLKLTNTINRLLAKKPSHRLDSAAQLHRVLVDIQDELDAGNPLRQQTSAQPKHVRIGTSTLLGLASVVVLLLAAITIIIKHGDGTESRLKVETDKGKSVERITIKMSEGSESTVADQAADAPIDSERFVADFVFRNHGSLCIVDGGSKREVAHQDDLPESFVITKIDLGIYWSRAAVTMSVADAEAIAKLPWLRELHLGASRLTKDHLKWLASIESLEILTLGGQAIGDDEIALLAGHPKIWSLLLVDTSITSQGIDPLAGCKALTTLGFKNNTPLDVQAMEKLARLPFLQRLTIWSTKLDKPGIDALSHSTTINYLDLSYQPIPDDWIAPIKNMKSLEGVSFAGTRVTDDVLDHLDSSKLWHLSLLSTQLSDAGLQQLAEFKRLTELNVVGTAVTPEAVRKLSLQLPDCNITYNDQNGQVRRTKGGN